MTNWILTEMDAKEAAMNGAHVRLRRYPPYLRCLLCQGDGSSSHPYWISCGGAHEPGWEIVQDVRKAANGTDSGT